MRMLISVILTVASIVFTTSSFAASSTGALASDPRNNITDMGKVSFVYGVTKYGIDTVENANAVLAEAYLQEQGGQGR